MTESAAKERSGFQRALEAAIFTALEEGHAQLFVKVPDPSAGPQDGTMHVAAMQTSLVAVAAALLALLDGVNKAMDEQQGDGALSLREFVDAQMQVLYDVAVPIQFPSYRKRFPIIGVFDAL
jgi:hypothetical protein